MRFKTRRQLEKEIDKIEKKERKFVEKLTGENVEFSSKAHLQYEDNLDTDTEYCISKEKIQQIDKIIKIIDKLYKKHSNKVSHTFIFLLKQELEGK